jgi:hypothetical protein
MASYGWLHKLGMLLHCWTPYWNFPWFQPAFRGQGKKQILALENVSSLDHQSCGYFC